MYKKLIFTSLVALVFANCDFSPKNTPPSVSAQNATSFFDTKVFFEKITQNFLKNKVKKIEKTVIINGLEETKTIENPNWETELAPFIDANINRPAWQNKYKVEKNDSTHIYTALKPDLKVRKMTVLEANNDNIQLEIQTSEKSIISENALQMFFNQKTGYQIYKQQKIVGGKTDSITIKVKF